METNILLETILKELAELKATVAALDDIKTEIDAFKTAFNHSLEESSALYVAMRPMLNSLITNYSRISRQPAVLLPQTLSVHTIAEKRKAEATPAVWKRYKQT